MNVIIYCRVSSDEQKHNVSLDYQEQTLRAYCKNNGYNIIEIEHLEDESGKTFTKRPVIQSIMKFIKNNKGLVDKLLFLRWDRYSRDLESALCNVRELREMGVEPNSIENHLDFNSPDWIILLGIYIGSAQADNIKRSKATCDGIHQSLEMRRCTNKAPRGYKNIRIDKHHTYAEIDPEKAKVIQEIFERVALGIESPNYIRRQYERQGFKINKNSFMDMLRNHFYVGKVFVPAYKGQPAHFVKGIHKAIIPVETFEKVQDIIDGKKKKYPKLTKKIHPDLYLRKYLICPICGHPLTGGISKGNGGKYGYYHCSHNAKHFRTRADEANKMFTQYIASLKPNKTVLNLYKTILQDLKAEQNAKTINEIEALKSELAKIKERISNVDDKFIDGNIDKNTHMRLIERYQTEKENLQQRIETMQNPKRANIEPKLNYSINLINNLDKYMEDEKVEVKCKLLGSMFPDKITFDKKIYRTNSYNKVLDLIYQQTKQLRDGTKKEDSIFSNLPVSVARPGIEPGTS